MFEKRQVKSDSLDLTQATNPEIRADNNQSYLSIWLLTQLQTKLDSSQSYYHY